jgi:hypothetical protein
LAPGEFMTALLGFAQAFETKYLEQARAES